MPRSCKVAYLNVKMGMPHCEAPFELERSVHIHSSVRQWHACYPLLGTVEPPTTGTPPWTPIELPLPGTEEANFDWSGHFWWCGGMPHGITFSDDLGGCLQKSLLLFCLVL